MAIQRQIAIFILCVLCNVSLAQDPVAPWILIDTDAHTLSVIHDGELEKRFRNIALGRGGVADVRFEGEGKTPLGTFRVAWINHDSRFRAFYGLDYPSREQAELALQRKKIDIDTYFAIRKAVFTGHLPPQDTALGGHLGIHGLGDGDATVHRNADWTQGCIALNNEQIEQLASWVSVGTKVVIR